MLKNPMYENNPTRIVFGFKFSSLYFRFVCVTVCIIYVIPHSSLYSILLAYRMVCPLTWAHTRPRERVLYKAYDCVVTLDINRTA